MRTFLPIVAGLSGTLAMTLFTELLSAIFKRPYHVTRILSRMLSFAPVRSPEVKPKIHMRVIGLIIHFGIGVAFSFGYEILLEYGLIAFTLINTLVFGGAIGLIGIIGWTVFFILHPGPPEIDLPVYLTVIWSGHIVLALVLFTVYGNMAAQNTSAA